MKFEKNNLMLIFLSSFFLLSGCDVVGPDFVKPDAQITDQWSEVHNRSISNEQGDLGYWWKIFNDPVLDSLIEKAQAQNLSLQIAGIRILEARAQLGVAVGNSYPQSQQLQGSVGHIELSDNQPNFFSSLESSYQDASIGFAIGWELDLWGRFKRGVEAADADLLSTIANYDDVMVSLTSSVASAYALIRTFEERIAIANKNVQIQERSLKLTNVKFNNGATTELDVQQAKTLLLNTQASIPALRTGLQQAKHALSTLLGLPPGNLNTLLEGDSKIPSAAAEIAVGIPAELLRRRPDIRRAELQAAAQSARIGIAEADLYPHFSLVGSIGLRAGDTFDSQLGDLFQLNSIEAFAGPGLSWDLFNYGRIKNNVRVQDARLQQLIVNYRNTVLEASREVEDAMVGFLLAKEQLEILSESVNAAQRSVDIALLQYRDGVADYQRVLDTLKTLVIQQDLKTSRQGDIATNLIAMYRALGGGWQRRQVEEFVPMEIKQQMKQRTDWGDLIDTTSSNQDSKEKNIMRQPDW